VGKQNLTVQLDLETVRRAEVIAAERGLSMSALVSHLSEQLTAADERYERAQEAVFRTMADVSRHASELDPAVREPRPEEAGTLPAC
jgi:hypothetical protein